MNYLLPDVETDRLKFRLLTIDDFDSWLPLFEEKDRMHFLGLDPLKSAKELCQFWFDKALARYEEGRGGLNALIEKSTGKFVGQCGLLSQTIDEEEYLEVGYSILPEFWGKGYATEAAIKCKEEGFKRNHSDVLISMVHSENTGSAIVAKRNGMKLIRHLPSYFDQPFDMYGVSKK